MMYPLVTELAAEKVAVTVSCRVLGFSTQAYYRWLKRPFSERDWDDANVINAALDAHHDDPTFGYRFIKDELEKVGIIASENRVQRLCSLQRIWSLHAKKRGLNRKAGPPVHDDLIGKDFTATAPNQKWVTDITEHPTSEGTLYVCLVKDLCSNRIVGYSIGARMTAELACAALMMAIVTRRPVNTIIHSDRGSQFRSNAYVRIIRKHGLQGSMGRVGACGDNAAMESFNSLLQKNVLDTKRWATRDELRLAIVTWIHHKYNGQRRQRRLGRQTPITFEKLHSATRKAA
jgi:putative transposase